MSSYATPGVYVKDQVSGFATIDQVSSTIGILIGKTLSGVTGTAQKISSWTEFISKYANGLDTPFSSDSYLAYAVYGFFQNGGKELYVGSIKNGGTVAKKDGTVVSATAKYTGIWGNSVTITLAKNKGYSEDNLSFDVTVAIGSSDSVTITDCTVTDIVSKVMGNQTVSNWLESFNLVEGVSALAEETITLAGGSDGTALTDTDYINALSMVDFLDDVTMVGIPGQTSSAVNDALISYCDSKGLFPIIDMPMGATVEETKTYRKSINAFTGALCYPWGIVYDPVTNDNKKVPACGHVMGVYARTIESRGIFKVPAGVEAVVRGFLDVETHLSKLDTNALNPNGVICIIPRPNAGIVIWGARSLNSTDDSMRYVSDGLLNLHIKKSLYNGTQFAVFEPNDESLRSRLNTACKSFLESLRSQGALKGNSSEAYYVVVDDTNNTSETIANGELNIEIGYAPVKPAEFIVIKLAHSIESL